MTEGLASQFDSALQFPSMKESSGVRSTEKSPLTAASNALKTLEESSDSGREQKNFKNVA